MRLRESEEKLREEMEKNELRLREERDAKYQKMLCPV